MMVEAGAEIIVWDTTNIPGKISYSKIVPGEDKDLEWLSVHDRDIAHAFSKRKWNKINNFGPWVNMFGLENCCWDFF